MKLLIDAGNTAITVGLAKNGRILSFKTYLNDDIPIFVDNCFNCGYESNNIVIISSVVPKITNLLLTSFNSNPQFKVLIAGKDLKIPIKSRYQRGKLGVDRQINVYGALHYYKPPLLILDLGTAFTADYVSRAKVFEGGLILPGPAISWNALLSKGAMLPKNLPLPKMSRGLTNRNTNACLNSGLLEGYGAMLDGLVQRFKSKYGRDLRVLATGGYSGLIKKYSHSIDILDPKLSIKSLLALSKTI